MRHCFSEQCNGFVVGEAAFGAFEQFLFERGKELFKENFSCAQFADGGVLVGAEKKFAAFFSVDHFHLVSLLAGEAVAFVGAINGVHTKPGDAAVGDLFDDGKRAPHNRQRLDAVMIVLRLGRAVLQQPFDGFDEDAQRGGHGLHGGILRGEFGFIEAARAVEFQNADGGGIDFVKGIARLRHETFAHAVAQEGFIDLIKTQSSGDLRRSGMGLRDWLGTIGFSQRQTRMIIFRRGFH